MLFIVIPILAWRSHSSIINSALDRITKENEELHGIIQSRQSISLGSQVASTNVNENPLSKDGEDAAGHSRPLLTASVDSITEPLTIPKPRQLDGICLEGQQIQDLFVQYVLLT